MKILHITHWPGPPFHGGNINRHHFQKNLAVQHRSRFIILQQPHQAGLISQEALAKLGIPNEGVERVMEPEISIFERLRGSMFSNLPPGIAFVERVIGNSLRYQVESTIEKWHPDVLVAWGCNLASILSKITGVRKVLYASDSMSLINRSIAENSRNYIRKLYNLMVAKRYAIFEQTFFPLYDHVIFISQRDAEFVNLSSRTPVSIICNGVDTETLKPGLEKAEPPRILFHSYFGYIANEESARFLADELGPRLEKAFGVQGFEIRLIGRGARARLLAHLQKRPWLTVTGYVEDLRAELAAGTVYVAPITMGAGVKNKVLEAMACGLPVVGTPEAFNGLEVTAATHGIICELPQIAENVVQLLKNPEKCQILGEQARNWAVAHANWRASSRKFEEILESVQVA